MALVSPTKDGDEVSIRQALGRLGSYKLGTSSTPTYTGLTLTGLTASQLITVSANKNLASISDFSAYVTGTANRVLVANDGDGTITLNLPQDLDTGADFKVGSLDVTGAAEVGILVGTPDEVTATSSGVTASITTLNTEVTTNDDNDLDVVNLADGTSGQVKHIYCVASFAGDTWKITPDTMCGGTQITFGDNSVGNGCTLVYADSEGWVVVANNGGTIS